MMKVNTIQVQNVNDAFVEALWRFKVAGIEENSERGPVLVMPGPFVTTYMNPLQRVLFSPQRDANPVFHLMEAIWMLAGRDDVEFLLPFNSRYGEYAESDGHVHGAYGARWRVNFGIDQIIAICDILKKRPTSRQAVLQMWDSYDGVIGRCDLTRSWKDRPCNTHAYFEVRGGRLNMTVCCRSNDMLWGAYGANIVHFSMLQEVIAHGVGVPVGTYTQFSNNFHVYLDLPIIRDLIKSPPFEAYDCYANVYNAKVFPLLSPGEVVSDFLRDCENFCNGGSYDNVFLTTVAEPLRRAYLARKGNGPGYPLELYGVEDCDWKIAFAQWCARRAK